MSSVTLHWVRIPLHEPFRISSGAVAVKDALVVEYRRDGVTGWGEASPMAGAFYSTETPESTWDALGKLLPAVLRDPAVDLDSIVEGEAFAKAGVVGALVDHQVRSRGTPLWQWLGSALRPVPSGVAIGICDTLDELLDRVARFVLEGYRRVKIKIQPGWDIEPVSRVRERFPKIPLMTDANAAYAAADIPLFRELDRFGLMMFEQPMGRHDLEAMAALARAVKTPLCADESAESMEMLEHLIERRAASIINIKVQRVGGIRNAKRMYDRATQAGLACWAGTMPELAIASLEAIHLATLPNFVYPTDVEASARWFTDDLTDPPIRIDRDGFLHPASAEVDRVKLEKYTVRRVDF
jgi:O-succinylbenzoate synthase